MFNLYKCTLLDAYPIVCAERSWSSAGHGGTSAITCIFFLTVNNLKYAVFFPHKGKSNTSFGTVKGLLLFVCTNNINNDSQCFYKINRKTEDALSAVSWTGALCKLPHRHDKYIYIYRVRTTGELGGARLPLIRHGLPWKRDLWSFGGSQKILTMCYFDVQFQFCVMWSSWIVMCKIAKISFIHAWWRF